MKKTEIKVVAISKHLKPESDLPCPSLIGEVIGGQLICVCCSSPLVLETKSFEESVVGSIYKTKIPKLIYSDSPPKS